MKKVDRKTAAYDFIKNAIIAGRYPEGTPIREQEISEALQMSRSPIREAIRMLESEGILFTIPSRGAFVAYLTPGDVEEICELRSLFEIWALERSIKNFTFKELDDMENAFRAAFARDHWEEYHKVDHDFHEMIISKSGSRRLSGFSETLNLQIERLRRYLVMNPGRMEDSMAEHLRIINCIRQGDLAHAKLEMRKHLKGVLNSSVETCKAMIAKQALSEMP